MKTCRHCGVEKKLEEFRHRNANEKHDFFYETICIVCDRARATKFQRTAKGVVSKIYARQRHASVQRGHPMPNYTLSELRDWVHGQKIFWKIHNLWINSGFAKKFTPSLDRIDNSQPYRLDNLKIMTWQENHAKYAMDVRNHNNCSLAKFKPVIKLDLSGAFLKEYASVYDAARDVGCRHSSIINVAKGRRNTIKGFRWVYKSEYNPTDLKWSIIIPQPKPRVVVIQLDEHKAFIAKHNSVNSIVRTLGFSSCGIMGNLNKPRKFRGFYWQDEKFFCESNNVSMEEAEQMWNGSSLRLINKKSTLLIGFGGNK